MMDVQNIHHRLNELERRLSRMCQVGVISEADYIQGRVKVEIDDAVTGWLPWMTRRAGGDVDWWAPEVGEHVHVIAPGGVLEQAYVDLSLYSTDIPAPASSADVRHIAFADGAVIEYDRSTHHLKAVLPAGGTTGLVSDGGISVTGDLSVTGNISATGNVSDMTRSMSADRDIYNGHTHPGVTSGTSSTGNPSANQ